MKFKSCLITFVLLIEEANANNVQINEAELKMSVENCAYKSLKLYGLEDIYLINLDIGGLNTLTNYKMEIWGDEYFVKITNNDRDCIQSFNDLNLVEENSTIKHQLNLLSIEFLYPLNKHPCIIEESVVARYFDFIPEVLIFPYINGVTLEDIAVSFEQSDSLIMAEKAYYMYGQAIGVIATTKIDLDNKSFLINVPDRHMKNAMFDSSNNKLYLVDTVFKGQGHHVKSSPSEIFYVSLNDISKTLKNTFIKFIDIYGNVVYSAFAQGFYSILLQKDCFNNAEDFDEVLKPFIEKSSKK